MAEQRPERQLSAILAADVAGYSRLIGLDEEGTSFAFAGIWRPWTGERKGESGEHRLYAFLTTESNDVVRPIHEKAIPVILSEPKEWDTWLTGSVDDALQLQRPLPRQDLPSLRQTFEQMRSRFKTQMAV